MIPKTRVRVSYHDFLKGTFANLDKKPLHDFLKKPCPGPQETFNEGLKENPNETPE